MTRVAPWFLLAVIAWPDSPNSFAQNEQRANDRSGVRQTKDGLRVYKGRVIAPVMTAAGGGAEWLERPDRDETEQPDRVIEALGIAPGQVIADVGAGTGYFSLRIAKRVAPDGKVLATDVQPEMLRQLGENMKRVGIKNIERILATPGDSKLPANSADLALMVDVYHELHDPERTIAQIRKALKPDGRLVLVEYRAEDPDVPIKPEHKTTLRQIRYEIEPMGFRLKQVFEFLPHQHVEVFVKDAVHGEDPVIDAKDFPTVRKPGWAGVAGPDPYRQAGFEKLFDGRSLEGWKVADSAAWQVQSGSIVGKGDAATLEFGPVAEHFEIDLQWRLRDEQSRAGVCLHSNQPICVRLDSGIPHQPGYPELLAVRKTAELTAGTRVIRPTSDLANALVLPGEWNRVTIRCGPARMAVAINGVQVSELDYGAGGDKAIVLQSIAGAVEFREIWLRKLEQD